MNNEFFSAENEENIAAKENSSAVESYNEPDENQKKEIIE